MTSHLQKWFVWFSTSSVPLVTCWGVNEVVDAHLRTWRLRRNERRAEATCGERSPPLPPSPSEGQTSSGCRCPEQPERRMFYYVWKEREITTRCIGGRWGHMQSVYMQIHEHCLISALQYECKQNNNPCRFKAHQKHNIKIPSGFRARLIHYSSLDGKLNWLY